jgi:hypothetical protein
MDRERFMPRKLIAEKGLRFVRRALPMMAEP